MRGKVYMSQTEWNNLERGNETARAVLEELYNRGALIVVQVQDRDWAAVKPSSVVEGTVIEDQVEFYADGQPLGGEPAKAPPGAFGNLG